jgi:hypothetical protein
MTAMAGWFGRQAKTEGAAPPIPSTQKNGGAAKGTAELFPSAAMVHTLGHGEVRAPDDPRSSLYNTDGQIFSDAGIPAVLFMKNYDINRVGYHDTHDMMANIDLDYGAAVAAIAIETVALAACRTGC